MTVTHVPPADDLKPRIVRSGMARVSGQAASFVLRLAFLTIMARLLTPEEFGLVAMVTVVTGLYALFTSAGLSSATVQRVSVTHAQISTLFWINVLVGVLLGALCLATAPVLAAFYDDSRITWVTGALGAGFVVNALGVQHTAILQRDLRYVALTAIEVVAQLASIVAGVALAVAGFGYWALVASILVAAGTMTLLVWLTTRWVPGRPHRDAELLSMLRFGGNVTAHSVMSHVAQNLDKLLLGRFQGADALGIYGRAFQLVSMPMTSLSSAVGWVAFSALSRVQEDPARFRRYFLRAYGLVVSVVVPIVVFAAVFADDTILVVLGDQWPEVTPIFQLLAPAALVLTLIEGPTFWLLHSLGLAGRAVWITCGITGVILLACVVGLPHGATGLAAAYSVALSLWLVPHLAWCVHGTPVRLGDLVRTIWCPIVSSALASGMAYVLVQGIAQPLVRLATGAALMSIGYLAVVWFVFRQRDLYVWLLKELALVSRRS